MTTTADKLHYVKIPDGRGARAEGVRLVYVLAGRPWVDVLWSFQEIAGVVAERADKLPLRQVPFVETADGEIIFQTLAIMHHAAHGTPAWPSEPGQLTAALSVAMTGYDLYQFFGGFPADDAVAKEKFEKRRAPQFFRGLDAIYAGRAFAAGDTPTFADCYVYEAVAWCARRNPVCADLLAGCDALRGFMTRFAAIPAIAELMARQARARELDPSV